VTSGTEPTTAATANAVPRLADTARLLRCPETGLPLRPLALDEAAEALGGGELAARPNGPTPFGLTPTLLVRSDDQVAYPVVDGVPILLVPEQITRADRQRPVDLTDPRYAEAYEEMEFYNAVAAEEAADIRRSTSYAAIAPAVGHGTDAATFPEPIPTWIDSVPDCKAQYLAYRHLGPVAGRRLLQVGGKGIHAVKWLMAGADEAWVLTPMLGEAQCSMALAREVGVEDRLRCVVGVAEQIPLAGDTFDATYSGGCVHHMTTAQALPEVARTLRPGGRFAACDPWRAPLYAIGTKILGKREESVYCRPLTTERVAPLHTSFGRAELQQYGTLTRYPVLALTKFRINLPLKVVWWLYRVDDKLCSLIGLRRFGSSAALFATK
jgi:SAM-dependent methyltransferase/uncharacterized protein YbaR (Trm112 family)